MISRAQYTHFCSYFHILDNARYLLLDGVWNVMVHEQKPNFVFRRNGRVHLNRQGRQFSRLLTAEVCASAVVMLDTPCSEVVWRVLATHSIRQFPLHFPSRVSPCAIIFQLESTFALVSMSQHLVQQCKFWKLNGRLNLLIKLQLALIKWLSN